uniref:DUF2793 domain-containing protein n=1 Tax=uncultured Erythrobacter sp. TaxID=263913 RepID=UPI0026395DEA|nr:DUF2793 domain-containing protein [uncultured Erythrobacter sp.]
MTAPLSFPSETSHFSLPLLFAGQAQKEFFINQSFAMIDGLLQQAIDGTENAPPSSTSDGAAFRIASLATGEWAGKDDQLAIRIFGEWYYVTPKVGMRVFDRSSGQVVHFDGTWKVAAAPNSPSGGGVVDLEARTALGELVQELRNIGIFST